MRQEVEKKTNNTKYNERNIFLMNSIRLRACNLSMQTWEHIKNTYVSIYVCMTFCLPCGLSASRAFATDFFSDVIILLQTKTQQDKFNEQNMKKFRFLNKT